MTRIAAPVGPAWEINGLDGIASATNPEQLNALLEAPTLKLDDASIKLLDEASA